MSSNPLEIEVLGDCGPFSELGKSIGYLLHLDGSKYLLDTGAPVFQMFGRGGLGEIDGIIATHAHEDHKRWFTDIALYMKFSPNEDSRVPLISTESMYQKFRRDSISALERSLSPDATEVVDFTFEDFVDVNFFGPKPRYRPERKAINGEVQWRVVDRDGKVVPASRAKIVHREGLSRPRMLYRDPEEDIWVEPDTYYDYGDDRFYLGGNKSYESEQGGVRLTPHRAPSWHGVDCNSVRVEASGEEVLFTSDTRYEEQLWEDLAKRKEPQVDLEDSEFLEAYQISGDLNDYTQQVWSTRRLEKAKSLYQDGVPMVHDVSSENAVVHTPLSSLQRTDNEILLTHSPDYFVSKLPTARLLKHYIVENGTFQEKLADGRTFPLNADYYWKRNGQYYVAYEDPEGDHAVVAGDSNSVYDVLPFDEAENLDCEIVDRVELYRDLDGEYFPTEYEPNVEYEIRGDGKVERRRYTESGSEGTVVSGLRTRLAQQEPISS